MGRPKKDDAAKPKPKRKPPKRKPGPRPEQIATLNYRQRLFVAAYLGKANGSAREAAKIVGYAAPHSQGPRLLAHAGIKAAIAASLAKAAMPADEVLARLSDIAAGDIGNFIRIGKSGEPILDLKRAKAAGLTHVIKSFRPTKYGWTFEIQDTLAALDKLARYHGLYGERGNDQRAEEELEADAKSVLRGFLDRLAARGRTQPGDRESDPTGGASAPP